MAWASGSTLLLGHLTAASETETASDTGTCWGPGLLLALPTQCWDVPLTERLAGSVVACLDGQGRAGHCIWVVCVKSSFLPLCHPNLFKAQEKKPWHRANRPVGSCVPLFPCVFVFICTCLRAWWAPCPLPCRGCAVSGDGHGAMYTR